MRALTTSMSSIRKSIAQVAAMSPFSLQSLFSLSSTFRLRGTSISTQKFPGSRLCGIRFRERTCGRDKSLGTSFDKRDNCRQTSGNDSCGGLNHTPCLPFSKSPSHFEYTSHQWSMATRSQFYQNLCKSQHSISSPWLSSMGHEWLLNAKISQNQIGSIPKYCASFFFKSLIPRAR